MTVGYHLGLGDAICCAAIIAKLATQHERVNIPVWKHNLQSVQSFYVNHPNVIPFVVNSDKELISILNSSDNAFRLGYYNPGKPQKQGEDFVEWFYRQAAMDREGCPIREAAKSTEQLAHPEIYSFVHHDKKRGFIIDTNKVEVKPIYYPSESGSILSHASAIENATEVHCIDSAFYHLANCLHVKGVYHKYARPFSPDYKTDWKVL